MGRGLPARTFIGQSPRQGRAPTNGLGDDSGPGHVRIANILKSKRHVRGLQDVHWAEDVPGRFVLAMPLQTTGYNGACPWNSPRTLVFEVARFLDSASNELQVVRSVVLCWAVHGPFPRSGSRPGVHAGMSREVPHVSGPFDGSSLCLGLSLRVPSPLCMAQARESEKSRETGFHWGMPSPGHPCYKHGPITAARVRAVNGPDKTRQSRRLRDCSWRHPEKCTTSKTLVGGEPGGQASLCSVVCNATASASLDQHIEDGGVRKAEAGAT